MDSLLSFFSAIQFNEQTFFLFVILIASTLIVMSLGLFLIGSKSPLKKKLELLRANETSRSRVARHGRLDSTLESLAPIVTSKDTKERESIRHKLMHAGFHDSNALTIFYAVKVFFLVVGVGCAASLYFFAPDFQHLNLSMIGSVALGFFTPNVILERYVDKRQRLVRGGVPDALDLLVVCTESGLGFNAALRRVADELMISHPDFADELDTVCGKIKAGVEMSDAFEDLIERTGVVEITGLVSMLSHASRIGGSLSQTLRDYTEDYRDKRNQEVEEIAAKIPTKMIFPLLLFIWPCFFIVAIGPAMLTLTSTLGN
ncbi:type II secretion system F family protein [Vibrio sp. 99-70-13A1]|uniref:type II secretion system F family protein n=1 Tax=Vibrio sp. 99-70-13A1 TaxID=2607601 RepID=UPI00149390EB|nr:type II secretion system F family protein [Vibrio sp. 99-70-13A1]NOH97715.1 type II secretion system F family protein [Vibrio sp. 99-70-13A1]